MAKGELRRINVSPFAHTKHTRTVTRRAIDPYKKCKCVTVESGWESECQRFEPWHFQATFDPELP